MSRLDGRTPQLARPDTAAGTTRMRFTLFGRGSVGRRDYRRFRPSRQALPWGEAAPDDARRLIKTNCESTPQEIVSLPTAADVEKAYKGVMADLPADYLRTDFSDIVEHRLGDDLAMVSGRGSWKNAADEDIMPFGMTYTLRRSGQAWCIVVAAIHAPDGGPGR
jgi:hypothetical protein